MTFDAKLYKRVPSKAEPKEIRENEIRITAKGKTRNYISYATSLLEVRPRTLPFFSPPTCRVFLSLPPSLSLSALAHSPFSRPPPFPAPLLARSPLSA